MQKQVCLAYEEVAYTALEAWEKLLIQKAQEAVQSAYAPYSGFPVGAAARLHDGTLLKGSNQENAAFPSGLCAERVLLFSLGAQGLIAQVEALAVYAPKSPIPVSPCGACRQVMWEYQQLATRPWKIYLAGDSPTIMRLEGVETLLPWAFRLP
ncbi:MAG: cytidine deaminase [Bacteroidia bacterium]